MKALWSKQKDKKESKTKGARGVFGNVFFYVFFAITVYLLLGMLFQANVEKDERPISEVIKLINDGKVQDVVVSRDDIDVLLRDGTRFVSKKEGGVSFDEVLSNNNVDISKIAGKVEIKSKITFDQVVSPILMFGIPFLLIFMIFRQMRSASGEIFSFGRSRARVFSKGPQHITFQDVGGCREAKVELLEIVDFLKNPDKYRKLGARIPKGILLVGAAGVGKTLLAKAIAGEADVPFFSVAGSEFMEMLVGVGSSRARDLFRMAKETQPSLIFIDEIDAIGRQRGMGIGGGHDEREQTLNQILIEMDGFDTRTNVIVLGGSVGGNTPIMIREDDDVKVLPICSLVDRYFRNDHESGEIPVGNIAALSYSQDGMSVGHKFTGVRSVYRHKVDEIYEIEYLGGKVEATGNHSIFVWDGGRVIAKPTAVLKAGDVLVDMSTRKLDIVKERGEAFERYITVYKKDSDLEDLYAYVMANRGIASQGRLSEATGIAQTTISLWHREMNGPRSLSRNYFKFTLPEEIKITPDFMRLLGYYTAEGYARKEVDFCFNRDEVEYMEDVKTLMRNIFGLGEYKERYHTENAVNIVYSSAPAAELFESLCGSGAHAKHVPGVLFEAPFEYYREFMRGYSRGDGYQGENGKLEVISVSRRLIVELVWLSRMHGLKAYIGTKIVKEGRRINGGKPLKRTVAYRFGFGKYYNFLNGLDKSKVKRSPRCAIVKKITKRPFSGFVYDLCGCENEAFFGGDNPILLHNTNRPDMLDPALIRPGRFDRHVTLPLPDLEDRKEILAIHAKGKPLAPDVDLAKLAKRTVGFSGADLENMLNEAAILAARAGREQVIEADLEEASLKVTIGSERRTLQTDEEKRMTAYHEAGHAVVATNMPDMDPVHRITIVARGGSLGHTSFPPERDRYNETQTRLNSIITTMLGGRAAEKIVFDELTVGAASDIEKATNLARKMVTEYGMSELGPVSYDGEGKRFWIAKELSEAPLYSQEMAAKIDAEIKRIIDRGYDKAKSILEENRNYLDAVAKALLEKETLTDDEYLALVRTG